MTDRPQRWQAGGWETFSDARDAFRGIIDRARAAGLLPGERLPEEHREALEWLLAGHPRVKELWSHKIRYFTFRERSYRPMRFGFVFVDERGWEIPFSTTACLTGAERGSPPLSAEELAKNPFKGLVS